MCGEMPVKKTYSLTNLGDVMEMSSGGGYFYFLMSCFVSRFQKEMVEIVWMASEG